MVVVMGTRGGVGRPRRGPMRCRNRVARTSVKADGIKKFVAGLFGRGHEGGVIRSEEKEAVTTRSAPSVASSSAVEGKSELPVALSGDEMPKIAENERAAVMVVGASGKLGIAVVKELARRGHHVIACARTDTDKLRARLEESFTDDMATTLNDYVDICGGMDLKEMKSGRAPEALQVVSCVGAGRTPDSSPERVEGEYIPALVEMTETMMRGKKGLEQSVRAFELGNSAAAAEWKSLDDVIMGGKSSSRIRTSTDDAVAAVWEGRLIYDGGGFCGIRSPPVEENERSIEILKASRGGGLTFRARCSTGGRRIRLKVSVKTVQNMSTPEFTYQASFVVSESWETVTLPWDSFVAKKQAAVVDAPPLDPAEIRQIGFVYSRFEHNDLRNRECQPGLFSIEFSSLKAFTKATPNFVLVSSAGVERNVLYTTPEERSKQMPIVQLNPGGVLNYKLMAENALRNSALSFSIIRPTGLTDEDVGPIRLEASQGDTISGKVSREEVAQVVARALSSTDASMKTFELRRSEALQDCSSGASFTDMDCDNMFKSLVSDWDRPQRGLPPLPPYSPPLPPPSEEAVRKILESVTVNTSTERVTTE